MATLFTLNFPLNYETIVVNICAKSNKDYLSDLWNQYGISMESV